MTTEKTEAPSDASPANNSAAATPADQRKPRWALLIATAGGLGYFPKAPGTWGALLGVAFACVNFRLAKTNFLAIQALIVVALTILGVWAAGRAENYWHAKDPQKVVIDEVSGQSLAYLGILSSGPIPRGWIYLLAGFILFRGFDIWKPFPARQAESAPGGWGIMADDSIAGIYAAIVLLVLRHFGL